MMKYKQAVSSILILLMAFGLKAIAQKGGSLPYQDRTLSAEERVNDLLPRMSLEEKVLQLVATNKVHFDENEDITKKSLDKVLKGKSIGVLECPFLKYEQAIKFNEITEAYIREHDRWGIPPIQCGALGHGFMSLGATIFPQSIAMGATWNPALVHTMAQMVGSEASHAGIDQDLSPLFDLARDPRYGRVEECYGEDASLVSQMGVAYITGIQGDPSTTKTHLKEGGIICTAKHMAAYSVPQAGINLGPAVVGQRDMRSLHLLPFEEAVKKANVYSIMPSYSEIDGIPAHANRWLLTDVLKNEWGFQGYVFSDAVGISMLEFFQKVSGDKRTTARMALSAGVDLEFPSAYAYDQLSSMVQNNEIEEALIDEAVQRVLLVKFKAGLFDKVFKAPKNIEKIVHTPGHIAHARKMAEESIVLLKNDNLLPLDRSKINSLAVIGPNADQVQFGDYTVTKDNAYGVTPLQGIRNLVGNHVEVKYAKGCGITDLQKEGFLEAVNIARQSDVVVVVLGGTSIIYSGIGWGDESKNEVVTCGEGLDRTTLGFPGVQPELLRELYETGKPIVLVMVHGRPYTIPWEKKHIPAILDAWYPGEQGGNALADILFGKVNPSGRLPMSVPQSVGHIPVTYDHKPSGRGFYNQPGSPEKPGRDYVFSSPDPLYPFGYGLSYSQFVYSDLEIARKEIRKGEPVSLSFKVKNVSRVAGKEVAQVYINDKISSVTTPVMLLKGFKKVLIQPGEEKQLEFTIPYQAFELWNSSMERVVEPGEFDIMVGSSAEDILLREEVTFL